MPKAVSFVSSGPIKFDDFVLDCDRYQLHRGGNSIRLEKIPMELLILLVSKDGNLVTREEIIGHVWGKDVFVDTEHGINTAIRKIRQALKDDPEQPRFIQTVTGKGYRFIAECRNGHGPSITSAEIPVTIEFSQKKEEPFAVPRKSFWRWGAVVVIGVCVVAGAAIAFNVGGLRNRLFSSNQIGPIHSIAVLPLANLSGDPSQEYFSDGMTDEMITALAQNHSFARRFSYLSDAIQGCEQTIARDCAGARRGWHSGRFGDAVKRSSACEPAAYLRADRHARVGAEL